MREPDMPQVSLFSTASPAARAPQDRLPRPIRTMAHAALQEMDQDFDALYAASGRDSILPQRLLRAQPLLNTVSAHPGHPMICRFPKAMERP